MARTTDSLMLKPVVAWIVVAPTRRRTFVSVAGKLLLSVSVEELDDLEAENARLEIGPSRRTWLGMLLFVK